MKKLVLILSAAVLASCQTSNTGGPRRGDAQVTNDNAPRLHRDVAKTLNQTVFEVIVPKYQDKNVKFDRPIPLDQMDYQTRTDKYIGLGTAFIVGPNNFVSAAHVFAAHLFTMWNDYYIRGSDGTVYPIKMINKYSQSRDVIEFSVEKPPKLTKFLEFETNVEVGDAVFTVGNAHGQGISVRGGDVASFYPEPIDGAWKFIRYSAPASPGNSGGPLVNEKGKVVGIVQAKTKNENLNFALPVAEFFKVKEKKASFSMKNTTLEVYEGMVLTKTWEAAFALPTTFKNLNVEAEKSHREFRRGSYVEYFKKYSEADFAKSKVIDRLIRVPVLSVGVNPVMSFVFLDKDGRWKINTNKVQSAELASDENLSYYEIEGNIFFHADKPKSMTLTKFLKTPSMIMDRMLKGYPQKVTMGGETLYLTSLGDPTETKLWNDRHGRPWMSHVWRMKQSDRQFTMHCTAEVEGATCRVVSATNGMDSYSGGMAFREFTDRVLIHYGGSIESWKEFLALDKTILPENFHSMTVTAVEGKKINFRVGHVKYENTGSNWSKESKISVYTAFNPANRMEIIPSTVIVGRDNEKEKYDIITNVHKPSTEASKEEKRLWDALLAGSAPYDGQIQMAADSYVMHQPLLKMGADGRSPASVKVNKVDTAFTFSCTRSSKTEKTAVTDDCTKTKAVIAIVN